MGDCENNSREWIIQLGSSLLTFDKRMRCDPPRRVLINYEIPSSGHMSVVHGYIYNKFALGLENGVAWADEWSSSGEIQDGRRRRITLSLQGN